MSAYNLPPTYHKIQKHAVFPELTHDEHARYNFLASLNKHISQVILPANKLAFEQRVEPAFEAENGRKISNRDELKTAIKREPMYQTWSALRRSTMEMRQQAGRSIVVRLFNVNKVQNFANIPRDKVRFATTIHNLNY